MARKLKFFNGRGLGQWERCRLYVAAYSQKHAVELLNQANHYCGMSELRNYWFPRWGYAMQKAVPAPDGPGVWVEMFSFSEKSQVKRIL